MFRRTIAVLALLASLGVAVGCASERFQARGVVRAVEKAQAGGTTYYYFFLAENADRYVISADAGAGLLAEGAEVSFTWWQDGAVRRVSGDIMVIQPAPRLLPTTAAIS
ncbi:MAG TPA: hypothetical protein VFT87_03135 [Candidatus Saccharimonadales bacterium]|nr:hypothetical protein [Candidatus Saccharimonadales bacterium]